MNKEAKVTTVDIDKHYKTLLYRPELSGLKTLLGIDMFLLITLIVMPQYFGIHIGYDFTCSRIADVFLLVYALLQYQVFNLFFRTVVKCSVTIPLMLYLMVAGYTMILRADINAFMLVFLEILTFYILIVSIRYVIGINRTIRVIIGCSYFLSIYGFVEFVAGKSLFLKFLSTMPNYVSNCYRSGYYRIMGPCGHPIGYGLLLILMVAIACYDYEKEKIYLYKRPVLLFMLLANIFLTGSRSSQGIVLFELVTILLLSERKERKKSILYSVMIIGGMAFFLALTYKTKIGNYFLMQITVLIDHALGTQYSVFFGADITTLENSENYREYLPMIFQLDWLNPLVGRGVKRAFGATFYDPEGNPIYIHSVDNYYICQYIKYAYPGMFSYLAFVFTGVITICKKIIYNTSSLSKIILVAFCFYFINLWWVDALQTLKFVYIFLALFFAEVLWQKDKQKARFNSMKTE